MPVYAYQLLYRVYRTGLPYQRQDIPNGRLMPEKSSCPHPDSRIKIASSVAVELGCIRIVTLSVGMSMVVPKETATP